MVYNGIKRIMAIGMSQTDSEGTHLRFSNNKKHRYSREIKETPQQSFMAYLRDFVVLLVAIVLINALLFRVVIVSGPSMNDTLVHGDWLILLNSAVAGEPERGDIIVASKQDYEDGEPIIKRVIAKEGQTVDIDFAEGVVYVDGKALDEPYTLTPTTLFEGVAFPLTVKEGCLFVMGDNRNSSKDSRSVEIGQVDCREVLGKAVFVLFPGRDELHPQRQFNRIGVLS